MTAPDPIPVALVGFGYAGETFHAPLIAACPGLRLHTVVSSRPEQVRERWPQVRVVADLDEALADVGVELVVIAAPNAEHAPLARRALNAGRPSAPRKTRRFPDLNSEAAERVAFPVGAYP